jgi:hypothetical protein
MTKMNRQQRIAFFIGQFYMGLCIISVFVFSLLAVLGDFKLIAIIAFILMAVAKASLAGYLYLSIRNIKGKFKP